MSGEKGLKEELNGEYGEKKKISCKKAFEIAEKWDMPVKEVGEVINELGIKIVKCQLGCF